MYFATAKEMERLDAFAVEYGLEIIQMMELAGWHILSVFQDRAISLNKKIVIVVGAGNKGGDGLSAARHLLNHGFDVSIVLLTRDISKDSKHHLNLLEKMQVKVFMLNDAKEVILSADIIIDALIGYHIDGPPRDAFVTAIKLIHESAAMIISYDLPTGIDPDSGVCFEPCIKADITLSLALPKKLFQTESGRVASGDVYVFDIGIPEFLYDKISLGSRPDFSQETL